MSNVHMAWARAVCGRIKSDYRYSKDVVYNNFPWPAPTEEQKIKIEQTAQAILDARALYPDASLADLYDETTMPPELRRAQAERQGRHAGLRLLGQGHDREQVRGGADAEVSEIGLGSVKIVLYPPCGALSIFMAPPWASTICLTSKRPSPCRKSSRSSVLSM